MDAPGHTTAMPATPDQTLTAQQRLEALIASNGKSAHLTPAGVGAAGRDSVDNGDSPTVPASAPNGAIMAQHVSELCDETRVEECKRLVEKIQQEIVNGKGVSKFPKARLRHQHIIAYMLANPFASMTDLEQFFGVTRMTIHRIAKSDMFQALVAQHRIQLETDFAKEVFDNLQQTLHMAVEVVQEDLLARRNGDFALQAVKETGKLLGMGGNNKAGPVINNNINVVTPEMIMAARQARQQIANNVVPALPPAA